MKKLLTDEEFEEWTRNSEEELRLMRDKIMEQIKELNELLLKWSDLL
jgi:hypothetical protein